MPIPAFVLVASDGQQIPLPTHSAFAAVATAIRLNAAYEDQSSR
jgi:hypothetical protein